MRWPFGNKSSRSPSVVRSPDVVLTADEEQECQRFITSVTKSDEGELYVRPDVADAFMRNLMAMAMMGRAERFAVLARSDPDYCPMVCEAAAKATALYPMAVYLYDFATFLEEFGAPGEARTMYRAFLERHEAGPIGPIDDSIIRQRDLDAMVAHAREVLRVE